MFLLHASWSDHQGSLDRNNTNISHHLKREDRWQSIPIQISIWSKEINHLHFHDILLHIHTGWAGTRGNIRKSELMERIYASISIVVVDSGLRSELVLTSGNHHCSDL